MSIADIIRNAHAHESRMIDASKAVLEQWGEDAADWERANRPWQDHTEHAKQGLTFVRVDWNSPDRASGALVHGVFYGRYLELNHGSRFSIIQPAVATLGTGLVTDLKEVWQ